MNPGQRTLVAPCAPREILRSGHGELLPGPCIIDATYAIDGGNTSRTDEIRAGMVMAEITASGLWTPCKRSKANGAGAGATALIVDNAAAFKTGETISIVGSRDIVKATHSASASSTGLALYLHMDELGENDFGHLESVTAGNADATFTTVGGAVIKVEDDDAAATGGVAIYFDEDAAEGEKLLAVTPTGRDAFIFDSDGKAYRIKYHATPSTPGVLLYFDDDGAAQTKLLFVSPTTANGRFLSDTTIGSQANITRSSSNTVSAIDYTTNTLTITAASWVDDDQVYCDSIAGTEIPRAILGQTVRLLDGAQYGSDWLDRDAILLRAGDLLVSGLLGDYVACRTYDRTLYLTGQHLDKFSWSDE